MKEIKQIIELLEQVNIKFDTLIEDNDNKQNEIEELQKNYTELDETFNRMHKRKLEKENKLYEELADCKETIDKLNKDLMDVITYDVYEKDIEEKDKEIDELKNMILNRDKQIRELQQALNTHEQDMTKHKRPLDDKAREHSQQTRQNNADQKKILILHIIDSILWNDYQKEIMRYARQLLSDDELRKILKVDMQRLRANSKCSDKTIREAITEYRSGKINYTSNRKCLELWLKINKDSQLFKNV